VELVGRGNATSDRALSVHQLAPAILVELLGLLQQHDRDAVDNAVGSTAAGIDGNQALVDEFEGLTGFWADEEVEKLLIEGQGGSVCRTLGAHYASQAMARRRTTSFSRTREVAVIGHNSQVLATVQLFVGGNITVHVYTADPSIEDRLALYPGVNIVQVAPDYEEAPADLPDCPYFICVDREDLARRIRAWLPQTLAIFHLANERKGKTSAPGFLSLAEPQSANRRKLLSRLTTINRVDRLMSMARHAQLPLILMYGDPDPDAIGAALGLATIWRHAGANPLIRYTGEVGRFQNKLLLGYLKETIEPCKEGELESADLVAVVDAQPGFWKHNPPKAHVIIDHHPVRDDTSAIFTDVRENYGSTSTVITEYINAASIPMKRRLATALIYGMMTDTDGLQRNTNSSDIKAYDILYSRADHHFLSRLSKSQVPIAMLDGIAWGIAHRVTYRDLVLVHFGEIDTADILVQAADMLLLACGINWVVCAGKLGDSLVVVFRGDGHRQDVGARAKAAFSKLGSAGGHRTMGRAEVHLNGEHVDATIDLLINNLFKRMKEQRRQDIIHLLRNHLHGQGPTAPASVPTV